MSNNFNKKIKFTDSSNDIKKMYDENIVTRSRLVLDDEQKAQLETFFTDESYPSKTARSKLSEKLKIPIKNINTWFQNRRAKEKRKDEE